MQIILSSDELSAAGSTFGQLTSIGFEIGSNTSTYLTQGFSIGLKHLSDTAQVNFQNQGFQNVYQGIRVLTTGWNDVQFLSPFTWNGEDHIIIEVCFSKNAQTGDVPIIYGLTPFPLCSTEMCRPGMELPKTVVKCRIKTRAINDQT